MAVRSLLLSPLILLLGGYLVGCAGNQAAENALKPDARLQPARATTDRPATTPSLPNPETSPSPSPNVTVSPNVTASPSPLSWGDRDKLPAQLKPYVEDVLALNLLNPDGKMAEADRLNAPITRREFAKWLLLMNNTFYQSRPSKQIRTDRPGETPVFQDIPSTDPDFIVLQSLAEAGILPSRLSGEEKADRFRPTDLLKREELIRWKMPLDVRSPQSTALEPLIKSIPFQDINKITHPESLKAIALDLQNGDQSNLRRALGYTQLFQPQRSVTRAEAAAVLWSIGSGSEVLTAKELLNRPSQLPASSSPVPSQTPSQTSSPAPSPSLPNPNSAKPST